MKYHVSMILSQRHVSLYNKVLHRHVILSHLCDSITHTGFSPNWIQFLENLNITFLQLKRNTRQLKDYFKHSQRLFTLRLLLDWFLSAQKIIKDFFIVLFRLSQYFFKKPSRLIKLLHIYPRISSRFLWVFTEITQRLIIYHTNRTQWLLNDFFKTTQTLHQDFKNASRFLKQ